MKYIVISEKEEVVSAFTAMGVESVLASTDQMAIDAVKEAIDGRKTGTLVLSDHVHEISDSILKKHEASGRLPFVMKLDDRS